MHSSGIKLLRVKPAPASIKKGSVVDDSSRSREESSGEWWGYIFSPTIFAKRHFISQL